MAILLKSISKLNRSKKHEINIKNFELQISSKSKLREVKKKKS